MGSEYEHELREAWHRASDGEVITALHIEADQYESEALAIIQEEARVRGIDNPTQEQIDEVGAGQWYEVNGKALRCTVCDFGRFQIRTALLNTRLFTWLKLDWLNKSARCVICARCGYIHWFAS